MPTPYAGVCTDPDTGEKYAPQTGAHVLVTAPTGGGKTESVLAPACIAHPGPCIPVSSKDDLFKRVMERRYGPQYLIDLRQIDTPYYGSDVVQCRIDPTALIDSHDDALNVATWLHRASTLSLGGRVTQHGEPYWAAQIIPSLAAVLYAASPKGNNKGIDWALHCVENPFKKEEEPEQPPVIPSVTEEELTLLLAEARADEIAADPNAKKSALLAAQLAVHKAREAYETAAASRADAERERARLERAERQREDREASGEDPADIYADDPPSWWDVRQYFARRSILPTKLERVATLNERQRDSVALGMSAALFPWVYESVRRQDLPVFDPACLDDPDATLYILAEPEGGGVGASLPLIQAIVAAWRRKTSLDTVMHNVLIAVDELTNTLPLPTLDIVVSEARGLGINMLVAVQAAQQIANRYDPIFMETLLRIFPVVLVMHGSAEMDMLDQASLWSGLTLRGSETLDQTTGNRVLSIEEGPLMVPHELQPGEQYTGRLIYRGTPGITVELPKFTEFLRLFDDRSIRGMVRI
ncbi:type IV secretory system conjugative DNA transfer family protein [Mycobacterium avium]|uniref:type IV secretory system conjugative DNA transfer family protein n=3 Tax=Mycobacterium avium TaxID=1764 RepID=UPI001140FDD9|nr:type IV secretory system conjugative DNA transfer family protein [Mycobacterium avium]MCA4765801.1 type IV secretory system conjugative DNA transfer family protein [Mycobacterium avium subsp. hominissuis]MDO2386120.1 type IV secretory system conjugative DNA transfer family protein [Mycobacterium avium subsp. hominissuis]